MKKYITMNGNYGCIPDCVEEFETMNDAIDFLVSLFELGRRRKAVLKTDLYLDLNPKRDGADYCEIITQEEDYS